MISSQFIQSCQSGDERAIQNLVQTYQRPVFQLALSIIDDGDPASVADIPIAVAEAEIATRETFVAAVDRIGRYREGSNFETWLFAIAIQVSRRRARSWRLRRAILGGFNEIRRLITRRSGSNPTANEPQPDPVEKVRMQPGDGELWAAVRRLDEKLRLPLVLRYYHDYPISEIAHLLHLSEGVVHARLDAAREKIALRLEK